MVVLISIFLYCLEKENIKMKFSLKTKLRQIAVFATMIAIAVFATVPVGFCTDDMTQSITSWLPTIISFAMLGMVLGMLKKFGEF